VSWGKENRDAHLALDGVEKPLRLIGQVVFFVAGEIPTRVVFKSDGIHHHSDEQNQNDLGENVKADPKPADFSLPRSLLDFFGHFLQFFVYALRYPARPGPHPTDDSHSLHFRDWNA
jgi:hypothetical protein